MGGWGVGGGGVWPWAGRGGGRLVCESREERATTGLFQRKKKKYIQWHL